MRYDEMEDILSGKKRGKKTTKRSHGWIFSKFEVDSAELRVCTLEDDQPGAGKRIDIDSRMHFSTDSGAQDEVGSEVQVFDSGVESIGYFAVIDFTSTETMNPIGGKDDVVKVNQTATVYLDTEHLVVLRDQLNEAISKAQKDGALAVSEEQKPGNTKCTNCGSDNAISETLSDSETGHIDECADCNYTVVYREDADTGRVIEDYQGFTHEYSGQYKAVKESH